MAKIMLLPNTMTEINKGANNLHVIPLTNITPAITAHITSVVPKSFCNKMSAIGIIDTPIILKNKTKSDCSDLLNVKRLCRSTIFANAKINTIFINSDGWILTGPKLYQLDAPLITGVIGVSGKISKPISNTQKIKYNKYVFFNFLGEKAW